VSRFLHRVDAVIQSAILLRRTFAGLGTSDQEWKWEKGVVRERYDAWWD